MTDFDKLQHPNQKSPEHGKKDKEHGPHEHGLGVKKPDHPHLPFLAAAGLASATILPSYYYCPWSSLIPVTDQGNTPQCVAYSSAYDQNQQDRPEIGSFTNFDEALFFSQIGGTADGAYMDRALAQRRDFGYPPSPTRHQIASFAEIPLTADALKQAFVSRGHGVLMIGPWYHSWFHPFASGKLPAPDYEVGGHAVWYRGYNDTYGIRARNSWGTDWGLKGDFFLPYAFLTRLWAAYVTTDK